MRGPCLATLVLLFLAGCAPTSPPPLAVPAPPASSEATPAPAGAQPDLALAPRRTWRRIPLPRGTRLAGAYIASELRVESDGTRRVWMVINLLEPIRLPETGGAARSAAYLAEFRCDPHAWNPLLAIWYSQRNAVGEALREPARGPSGIRDVSEGSFLDVFVNAACDARPLRPGRSASSVRAYRGLGSASA